MLKGDICLTYGQAGSGKTTYALWKAYNYAKGKNILDRSTNCEIGKKLFNATDSGLGALKASMDQLGIAVQIWHRISLNLKSQNLKAIKRSL